MENRSARLQLLTVCSVLALSVLVPSRGIYASEIEKWLIMPGPVAESHASVEAECGACHSPLSERSQADMCVECHEEVGADVAEKTGFHGQLPSSLQNDCAECHTDHEGREADIVGFDESTFDHGQTDFELRGSHIELACTSCHSGNEPYREAPSACVDCHRSDDIHEGQLGDDCGGCHNATEWTQAQFDHGTTQFTLTGAHALLECDGCHQDTDFAEVGRTCNDCHRQEDVHEGQNGTRCGDCHSTNTWEKVTFDHAVIAGFKLDGGHRNLQCQDCHRAANFMDLGSSNCNSCHSRNDPHEGSFGTDCGSCHNASNWQSVNFDHGADTGFPLPPGHSDLSCEQCHTENLESALPRDCGTCHIDDDPHKGQLGDRCESCHVATNWTAMISFAHDLTSFPLLGAHADLACESCHASAAFRDAGSTCVSCHADDDPHLGGLGEQCDDCHNPADWRAWQFDHDVHTNFALTGAHIDVTCNACHVDSIGRGEALRDDCNSCHRRDDPHFGRFGNNCEACHTTSSFSQIEGM